MQHDGLKKYYEISNFRLGGKYDLADPSKWENGGEGGTTLESLGGGKLRTAYIAVGTPRRNAAGEITNAVVINSYYSGDSTDMYEQWVKGTALSGGVPIIGPGRPIDTDRYYVVMVDPLGTWGASKPSDGLGIKFPQYSYYDMVQANYRMLRDQLKVARVALVDRRVDGRHADLCLGRHASGIHRRADADRRHHAVGRRGPGRQLDLPADDGRDRVRPGLAIHQGRLLQAAQRKASAAGPRLRLVGAWPHRLRLRLSARRRTSRRCSRKCSTGIRRTRRPASASPIAPSCTTPSISSGATGSARPTTSIPISAASRPRTLVMHITNDLWLNFKLARARGRPRSRRAT